MPDRNTQERRRQNGSGEAAEARRILERVERDSETIGTSSLSRAARNAAGHFSGADAPADDPLELWGRRIARLLALVAFVALFYHVLTRYILS